VPTGVTIRPVIHRSRRHLATLPARRGMRAHWLRRRFVDEEDATAGAAAAGAAAAGAAAAGQDVPEPGAAGSAQSEPPEPEQAASSPPSAVRPAFGHPTF
jgi:hypothetical protein